MVAGLLTEACVSFPVLSALEEQFEIFVVADACGGLTREGHELALRRMEAAGAKLTFQHPFLERSVLGVLGTYVTADTGTGAVHTAPSHGADDFYTGQRYGLDPTCRVDAEGHVYVDPAAWPYAAPPAFAGKAVWAANPIIVAMLEESGALMASSDLEHSYPHCWRCHKPVIFRATEQWFIGMETPVRRADPKMTFTNLWYCTVSEVRVAWFAETWGRPAQDPRAGRPPEVRARMGRVPGGGPVGACTPLPYTIHMYSIWLSVT